MANNEYSKEDTKLGCEIIFMIFAWLFLAGITFVISFVVLVLSDDFDNLEFKMILVSIIIPTLIMFIGYKKHKKSVEQQSSSEMNDEVEYTRPIIKPTYEVVITTSASSAPQEQPIRKNSQPKTCEHCGSHEFTLNDNCYVCDYCRSEYPE